MRKGWAVFMPFYGDLIQLRCKHSMVLLRPALDRWTEKRRANRAEAMAIRLGDGQNPAQALRQIAGKMRN